MRGAMRICHVVNAEYAIYQLTDWKSTTRLRAIHYYLPAPPPFDSDCVFGSRHLQWKENRLDVSRLIDVVTVI